MADNAQDRQLPASQRKIEKARTEGQVARSRDLGHFGAVGAVVLLMAALAPEMSAWLGRLLAEGLRFDATLMVHPEAMAQRVGQLALQMLAVLLPLFGVMLAVALGTGVLAGGWNFTLKPLTPNFTKIDPLSGLGRVFSGQQLTQTLKACLLALLLGGVAALYLWQQWLRHAELLAMPLPAALAAGAGLLQGGLLLLCGVLAAFALVDVPLQRFMLERRLRMSAQEMKQEFKEVEGNAEVKAKVRLRMREMANRRMLAAVPRADLVVMNPTHYAVALKYDESAMAAPRVVAKGADLLALRIRDLAREAKVPVLQAPPLARALYTHTEVDQEIPARLFGAVAQVLAWVYQLRDAMAAGRTLAAEPPMPEVPADLDPLTPRKEPEL
ncbi:MAG: flagellar biosynthesis protein FlhB [Rubrivivax sp.]|nr:flagellar biosynthesis protein FlhB [Rubrivivax sp.]